MKKCSNCFITKPDEDFYIRRLKTTIIRQARAKQRFNDIYDKINVDISKKA